MINRRGALRAMSVVVIGAVGSSSSAFARILRWGVSGSRGAVLGVQPQGAADGAIDDRLRKDIARLAPRADSEAGVPVILACENLVSHETSQKVNPVRLTTFNTALVSEFRQNAKAWERIQPNAPDTDVAKLIQILAYRDFADGGMERRP